MRKGIMFLALCLLLLNGCLPFYRMVKISPSGRLKNIAFTKTTSNSLYQFYYSDTLNHAYQRELREAYKLDSLTSNAGNEFEKIKLILMWTNQQWQHSGNNTPTKSDALSILKEARAGQNFRCVEYGIVASSALNSIGIPARTIGLKTRDVEKVRYGAGHVASEVYSKQFDKWIFIDPQFNVLPLLNDIPLNAVEFKNAIMNNRDKLKLINAKGDIPAEKTNEYINWIAKYLFYFDILFDQRVGEEANFKKINGMTKIMLVPVGEKEPKIFQRKHKINYCLYTNNLNDFYQNPK
jgi:hypothetical protein